MFAKGADIDHYLVMKWRSGQLLITPDEMNKICEHLGVANLFENLPYSALTKRQKLIVNPKKEEDVGIEKAELFLEDEANWEEEADKLETERIQPIFDRLKSHPNFYDAERFGGNELENLVWRAIKDYKVEGSLSVEELIESMGDEGVMGGTWPEIVDSWRYQYWELEKVVQYINKMAENK